MAGQLVDARGERLKPSRAVKKGRRYRYCVSAALITDAGTDRAHGWRLAAREIEEAVTRILVDAMTGSAEVEDYQGPMGPTNSPPTTIPVHFIEGAIDLSTIDVGDTKITITNLASPPVQFFTVTTTPCPDVFTGFGFTFSSGVDITGVSVDGASAADFLPVTGGLTSGPADIFVNVAGDDPATNHQLILDATTRTVPVPSVPEPANWVLLAIGLLGLWSIERRTKRGSRATGASP